MTGLWGKKVLSPQDRTAVRTWRTSQQFRPPSSATEGKHHPDSTSCPGLRTWVQTPGGTAPSVNETWREITGSASLHPPPGAKRGPRTAAELLQPGGYFSPEQVSKDEGSHSSARASSCAVRHNDQFSRPVLPSPPCILLNNYTPTKRYKLCKPVVHSQTHKHTNCHPNFPVTLLCCLCSVSSLSPQHCIDAPFLSRSSKESYQLSGANLLTSSNKKCQSIQSLKLEQLPGSSDL
ncbi:uncharacterized protein LOC129736476 [Falco cherrug]|uniref:uncharacterized protein LOC129736476 n=1 Tax=Falco cherrug TaxID=345164 RepID=UPI002478A4BC|nr:uncharacterized protein LOC129736476 [Falco cherrug]